MNIMVVVISYIAAARTTSENAIGQGTGKFLTDGIVGTVVGGIFLVRAYSSPSFTCSLLGVQVVVLMPQPLSTWI
jgi:hypothetical protein